MSERKRGRGYVKAAFGTDKSMNRRDAHGVFTAWTDPSDQGSCPGGNERTGGRLFPDSFPGGKDYRGKRWVFHFQRRSLIA